MKFDILCEKVLKCHYSIPLQRRIRAPANLSDGEPLEQHLMVLQSGPSLIFVEVLDTPDSLDVILFQQLLYCIFKTHRFSLTILQYQFCPWNLNGLKCTLKFRSLQYYVTCYISRC